MVGKYYKKFMENGIKYIYIDSLLPKSETHAIFVTTCIFHEFFDDVIATSTYCLILVAINLKKYSCASLKKKNLNQCMGQR